MSRQGTSRAIVDLAAIRHNVRTLAARAPGAAVLAVVKADAYGHGLVPVARAALAGGATWLGVAQLTEALVLRAGLDAAGVPRPAPGTAGRAPAGGTARDADAPARDGDAIAPRVLTWIYTPGAPLDEALAADVDLAVSAPWALAEVVDAARRAGRTARIHLKIDTGMSRLGSRPEEWPGLVAAARAAQDAGHVHVAGVWSHLACADEPDSGATSEQRAVFERALAVAREAGLRPLAHLAASSGILWHPDTHYDLVRAGIAMYGISPAPEIAAAAELGLRPALRWEADLALVKRAPAGTPVSYGGTESVGRDTWLGVVPVGYADGVPRHASGAGPLRVGDHATRVLGRVCMDQVVVDLGAGERPAGGAVPGTTAVLIAGAAGGGPTAEDWARAAGTIGYEIVTRLGPRVPRVHIDSEEPS